MEPAIVEVLQTSLEDLYVPDIKTGFDEPVNDSVFCNYRNTVEGKFLEVLNLLENICDGMNLYKHKRKVLTSSVIVRGQHFSKQHWTTENTCEKAELMLSKVLGIFEYSSLKGVLLDDQGSFFKHVLTTMRPWLLKETWKNYPAAILCYQWLLKQVESPHLSDHLDITLPTALIITDDFESKNRKIGLECLKHIIDNVSMTHLTWCNQDEVILRAIDPLFYQNDAELIEPLVASLVSLLEKANPLRSRCCLKMNAYDGLIDTFLQKMAMEQKLVLRSSYLASLPLIISARGLGMILHSATLHSILVEYILEPTSCKEGLLVLKTYLGVCWPRMDAHCYTFLSVVCKVCLLVEEERVPSDCLDTVVTIMNYLKACSPSKVIAFFDELKESKTLKSVLMIS